MIAIPPRHFVLCAFLVAVSGCNGYRSETFDLVVKNETPTPLTLSLAKDGPPYEAAWATPEDLAIETPHRREEWAGGPMGMTLLPPGKTATVPNLKGQFASGTHAYLRAYNGELSISQMLSKSRESPDRVDTPLVPGHNEITIVQKGGHIAAEAIQPKGAPTR